MLFDRWTKKKTIEKYIDPSVGGGPQSIMESTVSAGVEREVTATTLTTLMDDIQEIATENQQLAQEAVAEILNDNKDVALVVDYNALIQRTLWKPETVFLNETQELPETLENEILAAEKEIVKSVKDPRAPFLNDLYHMGQESEQIGYMVKNYLQRVTSSNTLYDSPRESNLFRYTLDKNRQVLRVIREQIYRVQNNKFQRIGLALAYALGTRILTQVRQGGAQQVRDEIRKILQTLRSLKAIIEWSLILQTTDWETVAKNLFALANGEINSMVQQMGASQAFAITEGIQDKLLDFTDALTGDFGDIYGLVDTDQLFPEIIEFNALIGSVLFKNMQKVEDHMLATESRMLQLEDARRKQIETSQKASKEKQIRDLLSGMIVYVESLQNVENIVDSDYLTELNRIITSSWEEGGVTALQSLQK